MVQIIAECGINHGGNMEIAKEMIVTAKVCGADLVKFQLYDVDKLFPDKQIMIDGKDWYKAVKPTQLTKEQARMLFEFGNEAGIEVFFSVFDIRRITWCEEIGVKRYKIPFRMRYDRVLISVVLNKTPIILSTGLDDFRPKDRAKIGYVKYLYCVPKYPAEISEYKLCLLNGYDGISDHTIGIDVAKIAMARGAEIIEKHFCLKRDNSNPDMICSIEPYELKELCDFARVVECVL